MKFFPSTLLTILLFLTPTDAKYNRYVGNDCSESQEGIRLCDYSAFGVPNRLKVCKLGKWQYKECINRCIAFPHSRCDKEEPATW